MDSISESAVPGDDEEVKYLIAVSSTFVPSHGHEIIVHSSAHHMLIATRPCCKFPSATCVILAKPTSASTDSCHEPFEYSEYWAAYLGDSE